MSQIETIVSAKPTHVWVVRAVPTYAGGDNSVIAVENWAESAMTVTPHTTATAKVSSGGPPKVRPIATAQAPEKAIETIVSVVRPHRSEATPPAQQPSAPSAITMNVAPLGLSPAYLPPPRLSRLAPRKPATHPPTAS